VTKRWVLTIAAALLALCGIGGAARAQAYSYASPVLYASPVPYGGPRPSSFVNPPGSDALFSADAASRQCFTKVWVAETLLTQPERVLVSPEKTEVVVTPGPSTVEEKRVLVKEASVELITIPATFRSVAETVVVKPGYIKRKVIPAVYDTVFETVLVREGFTAWRPSSAVTGAAAALNPVHRRRRPGQASEAGRDRVIEHNPAYGGMTTRALSTGEVLCLVKVPPEYKTVTKQVLRAPAHVVEITVPPETREIVRQVVDTPAHVEKRLVPAVYETIKVTVHAPDTTQTHTIPPVYHEYAEVRISAPSRFEWRSVQCPIESATPPPVINPAPPSYAGPGACCSAELAYPPAGYVQSAPCCAAPAPIGVQLPETRPQDFAPTPAYGAPPRY